MKEVTKKEQTEVMNIDLSNEAWGDVTVEAKDFLLPRYVLQQSGSDMVKDDKAKAGDYVNTITSESVGQKVKLLPFYKHEYIRVEKEVGNKFQFDRVEPYNGVLPSIEVFREGNDNFKRYHVYEVYCLSEEGGIPIALSFKSTSNKVGKKLLNRMYIENKNMKRSPAHNWIELGSVNAESKGNKFKVMDFKIDRESTVPEQENCMQWIRTFKNMSVQVSEDVPTEETTVEDTGRY